MRFLTCVEYVRTSSNAPSGGDAEESTPKKKNSSSKASKTTTKSDAKPNLLIVSGGDGFEDFRNSGGNSMNEVAGREDSTNHLLLWHI